MTTAPPSTGVDFDVVVIGAGVAGAALATALVRRGVSVALIDRARACAPCFKAEKVEPDQADLLRALDLFGAVRPTLTPIPTVASAAFGRVLKTVSLEQYGVDYWALDNAIRDAYSRESEIEVARVTGIDLAEEVRRVTLSDGRVIGTRLVVLAAGTTPKLSKALGLVRTPVRETHSMCFGFDVALGRPPGPDYASLTYYSERIPTRIGYITLFPIGERWRANLFAYLQPRDALTRDLYRAPTETIRRLLPRLERLVGELDVTSRVEGQVIDLYTGAGVPPRDGLVTMGDSFQSVCPATGSGLSKVLTDVLVLSERIPDWLETPGMDASRIAGFYDDPRKLACDAQSLDWAEHTRGFATERGLKWRLHRARSYVAMATHRFFGDDAPAPTM